MTGPILRREQVWLLVSVSAWLVLFISLNTAAAQTWALSSMPLGWPSAVSVSASADGSKLVEAFSEGGGIYTSTNSGLTWTMTSAPSWGSVSWLSVASSADGTLLVAVGGGAEPGGPDEGSICTSTNSGLTWTVSAAPSDPFYPPSWSSVASSADGHKLLAVGGYGQEIYTSTNAGASWTLSGVIGSRGWSASVASSADGTKLVVAAYDGAIATSTNSGLTWTTTDAPSTNWTSVASSADGTKLVAVASGTSPSYSGPIYTSTNSGLTWTLSSAPDSEWQSVASSADGSKLAASVGGPLGSVYTSTNSGFTWSQTGAPPTNWTSVASSANGTRLVAAGPGGVYVTTPSPSAPFITSQPTSLPTVLAGTGVQFNVAVFATVPISYQWQKNGLNLTDAGNLSGSATSTLALNNVTAADAGVYSVLVTNAFGLAESAEAVLEVLVSPPVITMQPTNQMIAPGLTATFSVSATGDPPLSYRWRKDGMSLSDGGNFSGTSTATMTVENVRVADYATYSVIVSNSAGSDTSAGAVLAPIPGLTLTSAPSTDWTSVASSADGSKLVAAMDGGSGGAIYTSTNSGFTWALSSAPDGNEWQSLASSADGTKLVAVRPYGDICTSTNSGFTWSLIGNPSTNYWNCVASSADGIKLVAAAGYGGIYTSTNSGFTWTLSSAPTTNFWNCVASSTDGTRLVSGYDSGYSGIYTSTNSGSTWTLRSPAGYGWLSVASSADGSKLVAVGEDGLIYTSTNSGFSWIGNLAPGRYSQLVAISADGSKLVAAGEGVYISVDEGATWAWGGVGATSVACSADGAKLVIVENDANGGGIYTWQTTPTPSLSIAPAGSSALLSWIVPSLPFALQQNLDLATANWTNVTNAPVLNLSNLENQLSVPFPANGNVFYRLQH